MGFQALWKEDFWSKTISPKFYKLFFFVKGPGKFNFHTVNNEDFLTGFSRIRGMMLMKMMATTTTIMTMTQNPVYGRQRISRPIWIVAPIIKKSCSVRQKSP